MRFREGEAVNVVFRFYSWDTIFVTRPAFREQGFLTIFNRNNVTRVMEHRAIEHHIAAVVVGYNYSTAQEGEMIRDWETMLGERGFERVVFLRAGRRDKIDGLMIVHDSAVAVSYDTQGKGDATVAAIPAAVGANVADPSGHPVGPVPVRVASRSRS